MSEHTKEPWSVGWGNGLTGDRAGASCFWDMTSIHYIPVSKDKKAICWIAGCEQNDAAMQADARRIVACVNACVGIPTELIEQGGFAAIPVSTYREVVHQRDELLAALKEISAIEDQMYGADWDEIEQARSIANAAIEKATKP